MTSSIEAILNEVLDGIQSGAGSAYPVSEPARDVFKRRYRASFQGRLDQGGKWEQEKEAPLRVAREHGVIAAAIARLNGTDVIDDVMLMKAAHLVELECHALLARQAAASGAPQIGVLGQWCW